MQAVPGASETRDTLISLILAGHGPTAAEASALQLLAHHRPTMQQLVNDLDKGGDRYLKAVTHEVLRHRPVFLFTIPRAVQRRLEIAERTYHPPAHLVGCVRLMRRARTSIQTRTRSSPSGSWIIRLSLTYGCRGAAGASAVPATT